MPHTAPPTSLAPPPHIAMSQMTLQSTTTPPILINDPQASTYSPPTAAQLNNGAIKQGTSGSRLVPTACTLTISITLLYYLAYHWVLIIWFYIIVLTMYFNTVLHTGWYMFYNST